MRKFIVKHFVLNSVVKIFGKTLKFARAAKVIMPLLFLVGTYSGIKGVYPVETTLGIVFLSLFLISVLVSFVYTRVYPVKWKEMDEVQKWQYGLIQGIDLTTDQTDEWFHISKEMNTYYDKNKIINPLPLIIPIGSFILSIVLSIVYLS